MTWSEDLEREPWRFDYFAVLRRLERAAANRPRISQSQTLREDVLKLGQNPYLEFPASNLEKATRREDGRYDLIVRFLGLMGPQGALPVATTAEAYEWFLARDDSFARFCDIFNNRFLQLFYRAWADSRPIAQHERPVEDRFGDYVGSMIGLGTPIYRGLDRIADTQKLAYAGLMAPAAKSAVRLETLIMGALGLVAEVEEFVGVRLPMAIEDQSRLGMANARLGVDVMAGESVYSVSDKIRIAIRARDLTEFQRLLPHGDLAEPLVDLVIFYIGEALDWELEIVLPTKAIKPAALGSAAIGWTTWMVTSIDPDDDSERRDARFNLAERVRARRAEQPAA